MQVLATGTKRKKTNSGVLIIRRIRPKNFVLFIECIHIRSYAFNPFTVFLKL